MRNILIPTNYERDTFDAIRTASNLVQSDTNIVLLSATEIGNSIQELLFLSTDCQIDKVRRKSLINRWSRYRGAGNANVSATWLLQEHHQLGISAGIIASVLDRFEIDLVIIPPSLPNSPMQAHRRLISVLEASDCPVMMLPYSLEHQSNSGAIRTLLLSGQGGQIPSHIDALSLDIVHQMEPDSEGSDLLVRLLVDALGIELVIQPKRGSAKTNVRPSDSLGIAVLSV